MIFLISHLHIDDFKVNTQKEFNFLKEVTRKNVKIFKRHSTCNNPIWQHLDHI